MLVRRKVSLLIVLFLLVPSVVAQNKLLTIDDIFDPQKRVNFSGTPSQPRLLKVNAVTGKSEPFYDAVKMQAAFAALPGISKEDARRLANQSSYDLNPSETGVLLNFANDLFFYEFG